MKKHRKQKVDVGGVKRLVDVPVDDELYKADNHSEYQRSRSKSKHLPLYEIALAGDVTEEYEEAQLLEHLHSALDTLTDKERRVVECLFYDGLTEQAAAGKLGVTQQMVSKYKRRIVKKLRDSFKDWL